MPFHPGRGREGKARTHTNEFITSCISVLVPHSCPKLERSRWNHADTAVDWCGLLVRCHQMFQTIVPIWIRELSGGRPASEVDFESHGFAALEDDGDDLGPPGLPDDDSAQAVLDIVVLEGSDAPQLDQGQRDKEARWDEFNKRVRAGTQEFAKMPVLQSCLAITRQSMIPHIRLTSKLLNLSSEDWCREASSASFRSQPGYRVLDCASGRHTASFFDDVRMRMRQTEFWESVPLEERSLMTSGLAFRLLSRGAGSVTLYLAQAHRQYPFKLFLAVLGEDEGKVSEVHHDPECTRDRFAKAHCKKYNTVEKLKSFESKLELKCTAVLARTDIVPCERSHSGLRRTTLRGLQTWRRTLLQCSADVFLATQRRREAPCRSSKGGVKRARRRMKLGLQPPSQTPRAKKQRRQPKVGQVVRVLRMLGMYFGESSRLDCKDCRPNADVRK